MSLDRVVDVATLEERLRNDPGEREGLVLANGLFDVLHVGHICYLTSARAAGRRLVVAVNSDASARRLKGPGRPVVPLAERLEVIASLACVDWATWFEEDDVNALLRKLRPSIHAKGTDYTEESVPERAVARELGIRTIIVGDPKGHASTDLIRRIHESAPSSAGELRGAPPR